MRRTSTGRSTRCFAAPSDGRRPRYRPHPERPSPCATPRADGFGRPPSPKVGEVARLGRAEPEGHHASRDLPVAPSVLASLGQLPRLTSGEPVGCGQAGGRPNRGGSARKSRNRRGHQAPRDLPFAPQSSLRSDSSPASHRGSPRGAASRGVDRKCVLRCSQLASVVGAAVHLDEPGLLGSKNGDSDDQQDEEQFLHVHLPWGSLRILCPFGMDVITLAATSAGALQRRPRRPASPRGAAACR